VKREERIEVIFFVNFLPLPTFFRVQLVAFVHESLLAQHSVLIHCAQVLIRKETERELHFTYLFVPMFPLFRESLAALLPRRSY